MIDHYNAFISYRHAPLDIKVAEHIHSKLEHFHIPAKIRKKTGIKRIQRIFRDKDELPITSDLTDTISNALLNSDYLIVICSKSTCESTWVKREIELFLKSHSRDHILAVLAEGEPYEVLPEELLKEEVQIVNPDLTTSTYLRDKEPLCCDYRQSFRKADKDELPRLAAALIGCSYDELMNRRRAYQMQRITALGAILATLALGFSAFLIWSRMKIQKNYQESLRNQSKYLAYESEKLLSEEKRIEAIQLALAALPSDGDDRPITSEAIRALTDSTLAYQPLAGNSIHAVWNYQTSTSITYMALSPEKETFTVSESTQKVTTWDTENHEVVFEKQFPGQTIYSLDYIEENKLLITTNEALYLCNIDKSKVLWEFSLPTGGSIDLQGPMISEDKKSIFVPSSLNQIYHITSSEGTLLEEYELPYLIGDQIAMYYGFVLSPDATKVAFNMNSTSPSVGVFSFADRSAKSAEISDPDIRDLVWIDNDTIVFAEYDYFSSDNMFRNMPTIVQPHMDVVTCVDTNTMTVKWSKEFSYNIYLSFSELLNLPSRNAVAYATGDVIEIYSADTGEVLGSYMVNEVVVDIDDSDGDGNLIFITQSGALGSTVDSISTNTTSLTYELVNNINHVVIGGGIYVKQDLSNEVIYYAAYVSDTDWKEIDQDVVLTNIDDRYLDDDYLVISTLVNESQTTRLVAYDANETELIFDVELPSIGFAGAQILGIYQDELYVSRQSSDNKYVVDLISMEDGEQVDELELGDFYIGLTKIGSMTDGYLTYIAKDKETRTERLVIRDLDSGKDEDFDMPDTTAFPLRAPRYYPEFKAIYYSTEEGDYIFDVANEDYTEIDLPKNWTGTEVIEHDTKGERWILTDKSRVLVFNSKGRQEMKLECNGLSAIGATFYREGKKDEQILVVFDDGSLYRYDAEKGQFLGKTEVEAYYNSMVAAEFKYYEEQGLIYIQTGEVTDIVDTNTWVELAVVWNSLGYHAPTDRFMAFSYKSTKEIHVGYFKHYTLSDLMDKAYKIIGRLQLTEEQKSQYGIS